jgi:glutamine---fructose-6-phosphate transaminase (isomerizing)
MCGIIGAVAQRNVAPVLMEGLKRLEYRGYDSAGIAVLDQNNSLDRIRIAGKVVELEQQLSLKPLLGTTGIAHTRWATHGKPTVGNAHPHICMDQVALVHNGIIDNHEDLKHSLRAEGYKFHTETDTEVIVNQVHSFHKNGDDLLTAVFNTVDKLTGTYAIGIISINNPDCIIAARHGSPLIIGIGIGENFIASDILALLPVTRKFIILADGDVAEIRCNKVTVYNSSRDIVDRMISTTNIEHDVTDKAGFRHYMLKEIFEQPKAVKDTMAECINDQTIDENAFGLNASAIFDKVDSLKIVACGTSYHAGLIAKHWAESLSGIPCDVEVASEFRYRKVVVSKGTLFVTISQSGETADTLAALHYAKSLGNYLSTLAICNVPESSLTREADLVFLTKAGIEIGVASTKTFTAQLVALLLLIIILGKRHCLTQDSSNDIVDYLNELPGTMNAVLDLKNDIREFAEHFINKHHALYLGRGSMLPVAMEGALKLKEISYIHAEAYPAGELKHGPLALVDDDMPVVAVISNNDLLEKLKTNLQEVRARGGKLYLFTDSKSEVAAGIEIQVLKIPSIHEVVAPIIFTLPLQLLAYYIAVFKGADVDQPRNLAKSVTVE